VTTEVCGSVIARGESCRKFDGKQPGEDPTERVQSRAQWLACPISKEANGHEYDCQSGERQFPSNVVLLDERQVASPDCPHRDDGKAPLGSIIWQHASGMRTSLVGLALVSVLLCACAIGGAESLDNGASESATATPLTLTGGSSPTPSRRPTPSPPRAIASLAVKFTSLAAVDPGSYATATIQTAAGASCSIDVEYKSGSSTAAGLDPKVADGAGAVSWRWRVGAKTTPGNWPVTVTCNKGGATAQGTRDLTVK